MSKQPRWSANDTTELQRLFSERTVDPTNCTAANIKEVHNKYFKQFVLKNFRAVYKRYSVAFLEDTVQTGARARNGKCTRCVVKLWSFRNVSCHSFAFCVAAAAARSNLSDDSEEEDEEFFSDVEEEEEFEDNDIEVDSKPQSGPVKQLAGKFAAMSTKLNAKTPPRPKKEEASQSQFPLTLPVIMYPWKDTKGQEYVSVDILLLSGMDADCVIPKVSSCCHFLELRIKIPDAFFSHDRLAIEEDIEDVKVSALVSETNQRTKGEILQAVG